LGSIPIIISLQKKGLKIEAFRATAASAVIMIAFLFIGERLLSLFGVDITSFALAGGLIIFIMGMEMVLGIDIFQSTEEEAQKASVFPVAFPLIAGAGTLTTILSLRAEYDKMSIVVGIIINLVIIFLVIRGSGWLQKHLGPQGTNVLRKVFGIILLAIAIKLIKTNW
jgi:multiple antibiotic resistance protein